MQEMWEMQVQFLGQEDSLKEDIATHSSILAWRIPWTEEAGGLQSVGFQRVGHDWSDLAAEAVAAVAELICSIIVIDNFKGYAPLALL